MRRIGVVPLLISLAAGGAAPRGASAQERDTVWVWNARCPAPTHIGIRVTLDQKTVYGGSLLICRWERQFENGKATFRFTPGRPVVWYGYRTDDENGRKDPGDTTAAGSPLEIDFWQAGGEANAIELGYSAKDRSGLHMNSVHILDPAKRSTTVMAPGLVLDTWPERKP